MMSILIITAIHTTIIMNTTSAQLRLWQLISPALPVGAYAYSTGQEYAVDCGWINDEASAQEWICGQLQHNLCTLDVPVLARLYQAWQTANEHDIDYWNRFLLASRESQELRMEDLHLGAALAQLLPQLHITEAIHWRSPQQCSYANMFALAAVRWQIPLADTAQGYLWAWAENQVAAAIKLIPLGQTAGQRILSNAGEHIPSAVNEGLSLDDEDIGAIAPAVAIVSAKHETQYSRLFRS
jgi:urease accessory protein